MHTGAGAAFVMFDPQLHTLFTVKQNDDTLSEINTDTCNGAVTSGCPKVAPDELAAPQQGPDSATSPNAGVLVPQTDTAYLVNVGGSNFMSVVSFAHCNAVHSSGCQTDAPSVP